MTHLLVYRAEMSLALTYAMRRPTLARACVVTAMIAAIRMGRPDLTHAANTLLSLVGGAS